MSPGLGSSPSPMFVYFLTVTITEKGYFEIMVFSEHFFANNLILFVVQSQEKSREIFVVSDRELFV